MASMDALTDSWAGQELPAAAETAKEACASASAAAGAGDDASVTMRAVMLVLAFVFAAAFFLEKAVRGLLAMVHASNATVKAMQGVPVVARRAPAALHPSAARVDKANEALAATVEAALEMQEAAAHDDESEDDELLLPVDIDELRREAAQRISPDLPVNPCSPRKRVTGALRGFHSKPLQFDPSFVVGQARDPTDFWLAKFALEKPQEFASLVAETTTEPPAMPLLDGEQEPLDALRSDVETLNRSLLRMTKLQRPTPLEDATLAYPAPTPVKQQQSASAKAMLSASPPVSPVLRLDEELAQVVAKVPVAVPPAAPNMSAVY